METPETLADQTADEKALGTYFPRPSEKDEIRPTAAHLPDFIVRCTVTVTNEDPGSIAFPVVLREWTVSYKTESAEEASNVYDLARLSVTAF